MIVPRTRLLVWTACLLPVTMLGVFGPGTAWLAAAAYGIFALIAAADASCAIQRRRGIQVALPDITRLTAKQPGKLSLSISNPDALPLTLSLGINLPASITTEPQDPSIALPAGATQAVIDISCKADTRGTFRPGDCYFETASPLKFWGARGVTHSKGEIRVSPDLGPERQKLAALFLRRGLTGIHAQRQVGQGREFEKLREYAPGDSFMDIHWKATARRGKPITRLYQMERTREIYVALDLSRLSARPILNGEPVIEEFIRAALVLGLVARRQGDQFGVITFGERVRDFVRAGMSRPHYGVCRETLGSAMPELTSPDYDELFTFLRTRLRRRALIVILTDLSEPILAEAFSRRIELVARHHLIIALSLHRPGIAPLFAKSDVTSTDEMYERLGGHMLWTGAQETVRNLQHKGVAFRTVENGMLSTEAVSQYMKVKARQRL